MGPYAEVCRGEGDDVSTDDRATQGSCLHFTTLGTKQKACHGVGTFRGSPPGSRLSRWAIRSQGAGQFWTRPVAFPPTAGCHFSSMVTMR